MISFVIPVYRSAETLPELKRRIAACCESKGYAFEIVFVEDGGGDGSWEVITGLANTDPRVRGFRMGRNCGQHPALLRGIREACGEILVTMDDDLQHPPEEVPWLLAKLEEGYDLVYGPPQQEQHGRVRNLASWVLKRVLKHVAGVRHAGDVSSMRAFRSGLRNRFKEDSRAAVHLDVLLAGVTTRITAVRVRHDVRKSGRSGYTPKKLILHALTVLRGFSFPKH